MIESEWMRIVTEIQARWPHSEISEASVAIWFDDLRNLDAELVRAAVRALYLDGREWAPNGAQILAKVTDLRSGMIDHGEAWRLAKRAALKADPAEAQRWLQEQSPEAAEAVRRISGPQLSYLNENESTVRAQFRDIFNNIIAEKRRDELYAGISGTVLPGIEGDPPRKIGKVLRGMLPAGDDA